MVTDSRCGNANSHSTRPPTTPRIAGAPLGGSKRKCALTMARNFVGAFRPGSSDTAGRGGTASTTTSSAATAIVSSPNFSSPTWLPAITNSRSSWPNRMVAPLSCKSLIAGSINTELKPSRAISGRQACPPASRVSRTIAPARPAEPSDGSTLSAASSSGCTSRWYSVPSQGIALPTSLSVPAQISGINAR